MQTNEQVSIIWVSTRMEVRPKLLSKKTITLQGKFYNVYVRVVTLYALNSKTAGPIRRYKHTNGRKL